MLIYSVVSHQSKKLSNVFFMSLKSVYPHRHCAASQSTTVHMWTPVTAEAGGEEQIH